MYDPQYTPDSFIPFSNGLNVESSPSNNLLLEKQNETQFTSSKKCPWKLREQYSIGVIGLHEEINDFYEVMRPTEQEMEIRLQVIENITRTINSIWPYAKVEIFGSFRTGLFLPSSDIDMVIIGEWQMLPLNTLSHALQESGISKSDITIISNAAVPIVKLNHAPSNINVDISFNMTNGVKGAKLIKNLLQQYPALPKLVFVLKQFLLHRRLNEVYNGGMSSYCLTLLIVSFLQGYHKPVEDAPTNLGTLLLEFFELYGINFNYGKVSIHFKNGGMYRPRQGFQCNLLSVEDPLLEGNDVGKGTYLMHLLKISFQNAFYRLSKAVSTSMHTHKHFHSYLSLLFAVDETIFINRSLLLSSHSKKPNKKNSICNDTEKSKKQKKSNSPKGKRKKKKMVKQ